MHALETLRAAIPDAAKDIRLNLGQVLQGTSLTPAQTWGIAVGCAIASRNAQLRQAVLEDAIANSTQEAVEDGKAAAALMAMNNVYYRFRHMIGKPGYGERPARLRMMRLGQPATSKVDFELMCLAVSAVNGCEACLQAHERVVLEGGLSEEQVNDAVRIAAVIHGAAVALEAA
jgi:alkyl hydroperoxide reductase subunit D